MKNRISIIFGLFVIVSNCLNYGCISSKNKQNEYINNDSTAIYSTHPGRPFRYGYPISKKLCEETFNEYIRGYDLNKGEAVAEIGAASGWILGAMSVNLDSITFYAEDIDTMFLNEQQFSAMVDHFTKIRTIPQTNTFRFVVGNTSQTLLPDSTFDKIIFNNTLHEIPSYDSLLMDLSKKIKPGGKIYVHETMSNKYRTKYHEGCYIKARTVLMNVSHFEDNGFYLCGMSEPESSYRNFLSFTKNKDIANKYWKRKMSVEWAAKELDKMFDKNMVSQSNTCEDIGYTILDSLKKVLDVYPFLQNYVKLTADEYLKDRKYNYAINCYRINQILFQDSVSTSIDLADAYNAADMNEEAIGIYTDLLIMDSTLADAYNGLGVAYQYMGEYDIAIEYYDMAMKFDPDFKDFYLGNIAGVLEENGEFENAIEIYLQASSIDPSDNDYLYPVASIYISQQNYEEALPIYDKIIYHHPYEYNAFKKRAGVKEKLGDKKGRDEDLKMYKTLKKRR